MTEVSARQKEVSSLSKLALKGSSKIVADYFEFAINAILFQRGIYPPEDFVTVKKYGLPLLISSDDEVQEYIGKVMTQLKKWIYGKRISKLVLVIVSKSTAENVERWEFSVDTVRDDRDPHDSQNTFKDHDKIQKEIQAIIRQITSSVTYLPILHDDDYSFNVLVYTDSNYETSNIPLEWCDTNGDGKLLEGEDVENVKFTSFSTDIHHVDTFVSYKLHK